MPPAFLILCFLNLSLVVSLTLCCFVQQCWCPRDARITGETNCREQTGALRSKGALLHASAVSCLTQKYRLFHSCSNVRWRTNVDHWNDNVMQSLYLCQCMYVCIYMYIYTHAHTRWHDVPSSGLPWKDSAELWLFSAGFLKTYFISFYLIGMLVVNVTWRNKTYVGTLLDCTRHDWAPPR